MRNESGQFKAGNKGRPKGAKNRASRELKGMLEIVAKGAIDRLNERLDELKPRELIQLISATSKHLLPTLSSIEADVNQSGSEWHYLSADQKREIIEQYFDNGNSEQ